MKLFLQPVLSVHKTGNDVARNIVAGGIDHCCRGIHEVAESQRNRISDCKLIREEDGAQHQLARTAATGDAGHGDRREHCHNDGKNCTARTEVLTEHAEQECDLDNGTHGGTVHVHRCAERQHDVRYILGDSGFLRDLHVGGDCRDAGACAEGDRRGAEQLGKHQFCRAFSTAEPCVDREEDKHVGEAEHIVDDESTSIITDELGTVARNKICEETEEADRCIVGDDLDDLHQAAVEILKHLRGLGLGTAVKLDAEAKQHSSNDQRQDGPSAEQLGEIGFGEEVDDHVRNTKCFPDLSFRRGIVTDDQRDASCDDIHDQSRDGSRHAEGGNRRTHDLAGTARTLHVCDSRRDGDEHHRNDDTEHHVDEDGPDGLQRCCARPGRTDDTAGYDADDHADQKAIVFKEGVLLVDLLHSLHLISHDRLILRHN